MTPRHCVALVALCGTVVLAGWVAARLDDLGPSGTENTATAIGDRGTTRAAAALSADAAPFAAPSANAMISVIAVATPHLGLPKASVAPVAMSVAEAAMADPELPMSPAAPAAMSVCEGTPSDPAEAMSVGEGAKADPDPPEPAFVIAGASAAEVPVVEASLPYSRPPLPERRVKLASLFTLDPANEYPTSPKPAVRLLQTPYECLMAELSVDEYLWSLYERTPKIDTIKVEERIKVAVKHKGKTRTVTKTVTKFVANDFTWKDPAAAQRAGMSLPDYVIGGMEPSFKLKLYHALRALDDEGLMPGITSAFRDDYRQALISGLKAATDSSYHGGSRRGGYGRGLAADVVSVKGDTRMERFAATKALWKWIDAHEKELGIGRPYLDRDPPHVGPIDGREFADKRAVVNVQKPGLQTKNAGTMRLETTKRQVAARHDVGTKRATPAKLPKVSRLQKRSTVQR